MIGRFDEALPGRPLLAPAMRKGRRLPHANPTLAAIRAHARDGFGELPDDVQALAPVERPFEVAISPTLAEDETRPPYRRMPPMSGGHPGVNSLTRSAGGRLQERL